MRAQAIVRTNSSGSSAAVPCERRALDLHQVVDRHRFGIRVHARELRDQRRARAARLLPCRRCRRSRRAGRLAHALERVEAIVLGARADDLAVELGRGVDVVVVVVEPAALQLFGLPVFSMPSVAQVSMPERRAPPSPSRSRGSRSRCFGPRHAAPMQKRVAPLAFARALPPRLRSTDSSVLVLDAGVIARGLRAVAAVLGTAAGLDREQRRQLHRVRIEMLAMTRCARDEEDR